MPNQDLIYSVLARPLGNEVSPVKSQVKEVSEAARLKAMSEDEQPVEQYGGNERRKNRRERRKKTNRRGKVNQASDTRSSDQRSDEGGLDLYV